MSKEEKGIRLVEVTFFATYGKDGDENGRAAAKEEAKREFEEQFSDRYGFPLPIEIDPIIEQDPDNPSCVFVDFEIRPKEIHAGLNICLEKKETQKSNEPVKTIVILPGERPIIKEIGKDLHEVINGRQWSENLAGLQMEMITYADAFVKNMPITGSLNIGETALKVCGPAVICRKNTLGEYTDVRLCDLGLIQACWIPAQNPKEEREKREDD